MLREGWYGGFGRRMGVMANLIVYQSRSHGGRLWQDMVVYLRGFEATAALAGYVLYSIGRST